MDINTFYNINSIVDYREYEKNNDDNENNTNSILSDTRYRENLLETFYLKVSDYDNIINHIDKIYGYIKDNSSIFTQEQYKTFNDILIKCAGEFMTDDKNYGTLVLFSYDYFDKTHQLVKELIKNKTINNEILEELKKNICV